MTRREKLQKQLDMDGFFWINFYSRDCDGCSTEKAVKYTDIDQFEREDENNGMNAEGPYHANLAERNEAGEFDLYEYYNGGQWEY